MNIMNVQEVPLSRVILGERLRHIDEDYAGLLAESIKVGGLRNPIEVRPIVNSDLLEVIAGGHRWRALHIAGMATAFVVIMEATDKEARLLEIDENLCRRDLNPLDRAVFLAERKALYEDLHKDAKHGGDRTSAKRKQNDKFVDLLSFTEATAERLGVSRRQIERAVALTKNIAPDVMASIRTTWLAESANQLEIFSKLTLDQQRAVAKVLPSHPEARTITDLNAAISGREPKEPKGILQKFESLWDKADANEKAEIRAHIAATDKPARRPRAA